MSTNGNKHPRSGPGSRNPAARSVKKGGYKLPPPLPVKKKAPEGQAAAAEIHGRCNAKRRNSDEHCKLPAGYGTKHYGIGRCKYHGGANPNNLKNALKQEAQLMGCPIDMNPVEAIIWCIRISAGEVRWLSERIADLEEADWIENTVVGKQMNLYVRERKEAQYRLFKFSRDAISLGLAERAIKLAEMYGELLAKFIKAVLEDLQLSKEQQRLAPSIVRKHLILLEGSKAISQEDIEFVKTKRTA